MGERGEGSSVLIGYLNCFVLFLKIHLVPVKEFLISSDFFPIESIHNTLQILLSHNINRRDKVSDLLRPTLS